jgi:hypothetical protein
MATADDADFHKGFLNFVLFGCAQSYGKQLSVLQQLTKQPAATAGMPATALDIYYTYQQYTKSQVQIICPEVLKISPGKP